jgi:hypothetical protein
MQYLALEIRDVHHVEVHEPERADARRRQVEGQWRAKAARTDQENASCLELSLTVDADVRKNEVPAVTQHLFIAQCRRAVRVWHPTILPQSLARS